ncbi:hypothetical protein H5158_07180 [Pseudoalteromonas sp. SR45-6]|uniref:hypothetical protein n=1 Tax=Pseudoalteromonas sp. SR45-6 TaxID=2760927 RepID=UPI0016028007|nr:hypothetical protein [Pseudoalteromonas sp. SR45-6]MBB1341425.1 hypothetical protein [Pseudoalteromonas sp. SR45-6]
MSSFKLDIEKVIADVALLPIKPQASNNVHYLDLQEEGVDATLRHLKLSHILETDTCISFDVNEGQQFKTYSPYLKSSQDTSFNKRCDFVVIRKHGGVWRVYFADLKSTRVEVGNIVKQLSSSKLFFDYILQIIKLEFGNNELLDYLPRFVCIHDNATMPAGVFKPTTFPKNSKPLTKKCSITQKQLIIVPVGITSTGKAKVSFNQFCAI